MEPLKLREALRALEPLESGYALALSTEGYSADKDRVLAFSLVPLSGDALATVYIRGGDPSKSNNVNCINPEFYHSVALDPADAWRQFIDLVDLAPFVIAHNAPFAEGFLRQLQRLAGERAPALESGKLVDTLIIARTRGFGLLQGLAKCDSVREVVDELASYPAPKRSDGGCGLKALAESLEVRLADVGPLCERNALALEQVFKRMLEQPC